MIAPASAPERLRSRARRRRYTFGARRSNQTADALELLGNETRLEVIVALWDAIEPTPPGEEADSGLSFSELYDRVGYDDSSNFNYHLDKLEGHFVRNTDRGYELKRPGVRVVEAVLLGTINRTPLIEPTEIDIDCLLCGEPTVVSYREVL